MMNKPKLSVEEVIRSYKELSQADQLKFSDAIAAKGNGEYERQQAIWQETLQKAFNRDLNDNDLDQAANDMVSRLT